jgi:hypothetical protein
MLHYQRLFCVKARMQSGPPLARTARIGEQCKPKPGRVMVHLLLLSAPGMVQFLRHT